MYDDAATARLWGAITRYEDEMAAFADGMRVRRDYTCKGEMEQKRHDLWPVILRELKNGADPRNTPEGAGKGILLHGACYLRGKEGSDAYKACELALIRGADVAERTTFRQTPLHVAAHSGHSDMVELLIRHGAPLNERNAQQQTPLYARAHHHLWNMTADSILRMIRAGAELSVTDQQGKTPVQAWDANMHDSLLSKSNIHAYPREMLKIHPYINDGCSATVNAYWGKRFDVQKVNREAELPRNSILTAYVRGVATEKERTA